VAIAHDTATRFPATDGPSGTNSVDTTTGDRTFSHAGAAGAKGAVVVLNCTGTTSTVTGVLYGGTAMSLDTSITDTSEAGRVEIWVLGDLTGLGGTQTVTLQGCTATGKWATCSTVTAATSLVKVHQRGSLGGATLDTTRQLTLVTTVTTMSYCGVHQGNAAPGTNVATGNTLQYQNDYGALSSMSARRTSADAAGSIVVGFNAAAASDDRCIAAVALQEYTPKTTAATIAETPIETAWTGTGTSKTTTVGGNGSGTMSYQSGDTVYVFGATGQASSTTLGTPTHSGANLPAFAAVGAAVGSGAQCWAHTWSAVATGSGTTTVSETATSSSDPWGIIAWVVRGSDGTGTRATLVSAAKTVSLTRGDDHSLVLEIIADYAAGSATLTWTPSGQNQREATQDAGLYTVGVADWGDQGSAGATSYGVSAGFDATGPLTKIALEILGTISSGQTVNAGQVTETETARPVTLLKTETAGQVIETETAQAVTLRRSQPTAQVVEIEIAQTVTTRKTVVLGQVIETEFAQSVSTGQAQEIPIGQVVEIESARPVTLLKTETAGQVVETETAQTVSLRKTETAGQVTETETSRAVTTRKIVTLGQVIETELAQPVTLGGAQNVPIGQVTETESAQSVTLRRTKSIGQVTETETARPVTLKWVVNLGQVAELESVLALTVVGGAPVFTVGAARASVSLVATGKSTAGVGGKVSVSPAASGAHSEDGG